MDTLMEPWSQTKMIYRHIFGLMEPMYMSHGHRSGFNESICMSHGHIEMIHGINVI